jgi:hypothetical protein
MQEFALFNYMVQVNGKLVRLVCEPGTAFEDVYNGIDQIKTHLQESQEKAKNKELAEQEASIATDS